MSYYVEAEAKLQLDKWKLNQRKQKNEQSILHRQIKKQQIQNSNSYRSPFTRSQVYPSIINIHQSKRNISPSLSAISKNQEYFREMEATMLSQNKNLKQHNLFLKNQIQTMFERERRYKLHLTQSKQKIKQLQTLNSHLQQQLKNLINNIMNQIQRIQSFLQQQHIVDNLFISTNQQNLQKRSRYASQTQSTINKDLQDLKSKIKQIYDKNVSQQYSPTFQRTNIKVNLNNYINQNQQQQHKNKLQVNLMEEYYKQDLQLPVSLINSSKKNSRRSSQSRSRVRQ